MRTPAGPNLLDNPSFEIVDPADASRPQHWTPEGWGTNTAVFEYAKDGKTGTRSGKVTITSYTDGDAKWSFDAIGATPGATYLFTDNYKSTVPTKLVAACQLANGAKTMQYETLATVPASANWTTVGASLTVPPNTSKVTVYHLLAAAGTLQIDDVRLALLPDQMPDLSSGVPNGNLEDSVDVDVDQPLAWKSSTWGKNTTAFAYTHTGRSGSRGLAVTVSNYTEGNSSWYFDAQSVKAGTRYLFSDYYTASAASEMILRATLSDGTFRYARLGAMPASESFKVGKVAFDVPVGAVAVTVLHGLAANGSLQIDDAALKELPAIPLADGVPNGSLEQPAYSGATTPASWYTNLWGQNDAKFSYPNEGHSGSHSVAVDITTYTTGSAAWYFAPQTVDPKRPYRLNEYYRSSVDTKVQVLATLTDGTQAYVNLPTAFAAPDWASYSAKVSLPANTASVEVLHSLAAAGHLQLDDVTFVPTVTLPLQRGLVSLTFDDAWLTDDTQVLPILVKHAVVSTHYILTGPLGEPDRLSLNMVRDLQAHGSQLAGHTVTHRDLTTLSAAELATELTDSKQLLEANGFGAIPDFASPYGAYNAPVIGAIKPRYQSHRTTDVGYNSPDDFDIYRLKVQNMRSTTTLEEVDSWAARAAAERTWLIIVYHDVVTDAATGTQYSTTAANLDAQISTIAKHELPFVTVRQALDEVVPQLAASR